VQTGAQEFDESGQHAAPQPGHDVSADSKHAEGAPPKTDTQLSEGRSVAGDEQAKFLVTLSKEAVAFKKIEVELVALSAEREKFVIPMKREGPTSRVFAVDAIALPKDGAYKLKAVLRAELRKGEAVSAESPVVAFSLTSRATRPPVSQHGKHEHGKHEDEGEEKPKGSSSNLPIVPLVVVSLCNGAALVLGLYLLSRKSSKSSVTAQKYLPHKQLLDAIAELEERVAANTLELGDPLLQTLEEQNVTARDSSDASTKQAEQASEGGE
jgi:hypothetical protein